MAKRTPKQRDPGDAMREMRTKGVEQTLPGTNRIVRLRTIDAADLLRKGDVPDILTPLVIKSVYQEVSDKEVKDFLGQIRNRVEDALIMADTLEYVCKASIMDGTKVDELTIGEKRWIFRLALGPAELLVDFRYEEEPDVVAVDEGKDVSSAAQ